MRKPLSDVRILAPVIAFLLAALCGGCTADPMRDPRMHTSQFAGSGELALPVSSIASRRFAVVVKQQYDFSCGSAALATLLTFQYGDRQSETDIFLGMWRNGNRDQIRKLGFSLLDMKRYLQSRGLDGEGYRISLAQLEKGRVSGIALVTTKGYRHFVVVKGIDRDSVLVGDPALGVKAIPRHEFAKTWNGIYFVIAKHQGTPAFNAVADWKLTPRARFTDASEPLSLQALALMSPSFGDL